MFMLNDKPLPLDTAFEVDGTHYPANWLRLTSLEEKQAIGITEVPDPEPYDDRFYWGVDNPKDLDQLKKQWTAQVKDTAHKLMQPTDWMVWRKAERDVAIPNAVSAFRAAIVAESNRLETDIVGCADVPSLINVIATQNWPTTESK
jgi:hypothetical protein